MNRHVCLPLVLAGNGPEAEYDHLDLDKAIVE
jgi:hypothetical protein